MNFKKKISDYRRKSDVSTLGECIDELLGYYKLRKKFNQTSIIASWEKIMGKTVANRTEKIFFRDKTLFVKLSSSPLKQELNIAKPKVLALINNEFPQEVIEEVVFL